VTINDMRTWWAKATRVQREHVLRYAFGETSPSIYTTAKKDFGDLEITEVSGMAAAAKHAGSLNMAAL
jgi:hypothetical protein